MYFFTLLSKTIRMTSKKLDLLEKLKRDEQRLKLRQKELAEEIELDIYRQKLLEQSGTIIKLKTQIDLFKNKIMEEEIAPNNYGLLIHNKLVEYNEKKMKNNMDTDSCFQELRKMQKAMYPGSNQDPKFKRDKITIKEYFDNIAFCSDKTLEDLNKLIEIGKYCGRRLNHNNAKELVSGNFPGISGYHMLPILTTILGVLDKQAKSIEDINKRIDDLSN